MTSFRSAVHWSRSSRSRRASRTTSLAELYRPLFTFVWTSCSSSGVRWTFIDGSSGNLHRYSDDSVSVHLCQSWTGIPRSGLDTRRAKYFPKVPPLSFSFPLPTVCLDATSLVVCSYGCDDGRIGCV